MDILPNLELAMLKSEPAYERLRKRVAQIAGLLEEKKTIPIVRLQMSHIQDVLSEEWWQDVTLPMPEATHGFVDVSLLYESPFTDVAPQGPDGIFSADQVDKIMGLLEKIKQTAVQKLTNRMRVEGRLTGRPQCRPPQRSLRT